MNISKPAVSILIFTFLSVSVVDATPPPDTIMVPIKQVIDILGNPENQKSGRCPKP